jgi:parvulin-like peptidyl-prolyl isomerase
MGFIINGETVEHEVIEEEFEAIKQHYQNLGEVVCCDRDEEFMGYARDNVLNRTLLLQAARKKFGEPSDADIDATIAKLKEEHGGEEKFYENTGYEPTDEFKIRRKVATTISVDKMVEDAVGDEPEPTEDELRAFYEEHIDRYMSPEEVSAGHIFREPKSQEDAEVCFADLRAARERLLAGEDFATVAKEVSDKKEDDEINLEYFKRGELMHEIEILTFSMNDDEISPVIATHFGLHLLKKTGTKKPEPIPFEELRDQLAETFVIDRREGRINGCIEALKEGAEIEETQPEWMQDAVETEPAHEHEPA